MKVDICESPEQVRDLLGESWDWSKVTPGIGWWEALVRGLQYRPYYLVCKSSGQAMGCLPLMLVESWLFGKFLVSLPYLNSGGVVLQGEQGDAQVHKDVAESVDVHKDCAIGCRQDYVNKFLWDLKNPPEHINFI